MSAPGTDERRTGADDRRTQQRGIALQRGIVILPSAFTLGNLFFGVYSMVAAFRGDFVWASWFIVVAALLDTLDGRVARFTRTGSAFGTELDSLVDAVSFGVAPGLLIYRLHFEEGVWSWLIVFVYVAAVVVRLARFNIEQAGRARTHFHGLPSPTAGMILATYYPFTLTPFFQDALVGLPWTQILAVSVVLLSVLMLSHVPYPVVPRIGFRSVRGVATSALLLGGLFAAVTVPRYFFFPLLVVYTVWGLVKAVLLGLVDRLPDRDPLLDVDADEADEGQAEVRDLDYRDLAPGRFARRTGDDPEDGGDDPGDAGDEPPADMDESASDVDQSPPGEGEDTRDEDVDVDVDADEDADDGGGERR